ncbi:Snakin-2 [Glycine max]|nr:Snakin-2 [Glycine max]
MPAINATTSLSSPLQVPKPKVQYGNQNSQLQTMAISKALLVSVLIFSIILNHVESDTMATTTLGNEPSFNFSSSNIDCCVECNRRCQLSSRPNLCKRACGTCCQRCNCVPTGTYGHYEECPCYANMTTHKGKHKCP